MNNYSHLASIIEALLFASGEPLTVSKLANLTERPVSDVKVALSQLEEMLRPRGVRLLQKDEAVTLVTASHISSYVEKLIKEEVLGDLSKAALETLTVVAYQHPISRPAIDYIRGVNSSFMLRNLMARGLVERVAASGQRVYHYQPTMEFMRFLGLSSFSDLPEYNRIKKEFVNGVEHEAAHESY